jgi:hypothetical protein
LILLCFLALFLVKRLLLLACEIGLLALRDQQAKIFPQVFHRGVEWFYRTVCTRLHHSALHHCQDKLRESFEIYIFGNSLTGVFETFFDCGSPAVEIVRQAFVYAELLFGNLEREPSDGAAVRATSGEEIFSVEIQNSKDPLDGILHLAEDWLNHYWHQRLDVELEYREEQLFFCFKAVVEAAGVGVGAFEYFGDSGSGVAAKPEEVEGGFDDTLTSWGAG